MISIKKANLTDNQLVLDLAKRTFIDTYYHLNEPKNIDPYLEQHFNLAQVEQELSSTSNHFYLAYWENQLAGYLKVRENSTSKLANYQVVEIERIYVDKAFQGKKIGAALMEQATKTAIELACDYIWLGVWSENDKAMAFYKKQGFEPFGTHVFMMGTDEQEDFLLKKKV